MTPEHALLQAVMTQAAEHLRESPVPSEVRSALRFFASPRSGMPWMADVLGLDLDAVRDAAAGIARRRLDQLIEKPEEDPCSRSRVYSRCGNDDVAAELTWPPDRRVSFIRQLLAERLGRPWGEPERKHVMTALCEWPGRGAFLVLAAPGWGRVVDLDGGAITRRVPVDQLLRAGPWDAVQSPERAALAVRRAEEVESSA
jgi:hypothetical protein